MAAESLAGDDALPVAAVACCAYLSRRRDEKGGIVDDAAKNRRWLADIGRRNRVGKSFEKEVRAMLRGHGLLDGPVPDGVRGLVEDTYRREQDRARTYQRSVEVLRAWQRDLEGVADALKEARRLIALAGWPATTPPPDEAALPPLVQGSDTVH